MADPYGFEDALDPDEDHRSTVEIGESRVAVTDRRVLVRDADGALRAVDRAEVSGLERSARGSRRSLFSAASFGILAAILGLAGAVVAREFSFEAPEFDEEAAENIGAGGAGGLVEWMFALFENLDLLLFGAAGLFGLFAVALGAYYRFVTHESVLTLALGGEQSDIYLPLEFATADAHRRLEHSLATEGVIESDRVEEWQTNRSGNQYGRGAEAADTSEGWGAETADSNGEWSSDGSEDADEGWGAETADSNGEWSSDGSEDTGDGW